MRIEKNLIVVTLMMLSFFGSASFSDLFGQEWMKDLLGDDIKTERNFFEIKDRATSYFEKERNEYYSRFFEIDDIPELKYKNIRSYISYKRWEEYWQNHIDTNGLPVSPLTEFAEYQKFLTNSSKALPANWTNINRTSAPGGYWGMGRIREIEFHPTDPNTFWLGADQGGIWLTRDNGLTYTPIGDGLPFLRVSSICVDKTDPDIIYMAGGGIGTNYWQRAIGVYKTLDGGITWNATGFTSELAEGKYVRRLVMSPKNPNILLLSTRTSTYRTDDGGVSWNNVLTGEAWDIVFHPDGNTVILGKGSDIYLSDNTGQNWRRVNNVSSSGIFKHLAVSPIDPDYFVAQLEGSGFTSIYLSVDKGQNWTFQSTINDDTGGTIGFSSIDRETMYRGWTKIFKSTDSGVTWTQKTNWYSTLQYDVVHADHFRIEKNPLKEDTLYFCNDGGLYIYSETNDKWTERSEGLIISQYYSLSSSQSDPNVLLCGSQDNGGWYRQSNRAWRTTNGGDGMHTWQDPIRTTYGYSSYPGGKIYRSESAWNYYNSLYDNISPDPGEGDWNSRFDIDPNNTGRIVTGCFNDVYESLDKGNNWTKISNNLTGGYNLHKITIPVANSDIIYASSGDYFYATFNRGQSWVEKRVPGGGRIEDIVASDYDPHLVWLVTSGYNSGSKVFQSNNGGKNWTNISGSLPNLPGLSIAHQQGTRENLYIGMTYGIYFRGNGMTDWVFYGHGIPNTEVRDLDIQYSTGKIRCATYGRGLYEADLVPTVGTVPVAEFNFDNNILCAGETLQFQNTSVDATTYKWNFGDGTTSTLENPTHSFQKVGTYTVRLTAFNGDLTASFIGDKEIVIKPFLIPFYTGAVNRTDLGGGSYNNAGGKGLFFNVHYPSEIISIKLYSADKQRKTFRILDPDGNEINSVTTNIAQGETRVLLNTEILPGKEYRLVVDDESGLFYNLSGAKFPYGKSKMISITGNTDFSEDSYYFFYDWEVQAQSCEINDLPVLDNGENIAINQLLVYPNPVTDNTNISIRGFEPDKNITLRIFTSNGNLIYREELYSARDVNIESSAFGSHFGALIIEVENGENRVSKRILRIRR